MKTEHELKELDVNMESLIVYLNPYFDHQSSHKVIEFLIKIYQINIYNAKIVLLTFLPFHQSKVFVKLIQNINLDEIKNFMFMSNSAKKGSIVLKEMIVNECSKNYEFFKEILDFYTKNLLDGYKLTAYSNFIFDLVNKVLLLKEKLNENVITIVIRFINNLLIFTKKKKTTFDNKTNNQGIFNGISDILITIITKFEISNDYIKAITNEYIQSVLPKVSKQTNLLSKLTKTLLIIFTIKVNKNK